MHPALVIPAQAGVYAEEACNIPAIYFVFFSSTFTCSSYFGFVACRTFHMGLCRLRRFSPCAPTGVPLRHGYHLIFYGIAIYLGKILPMI